MNDNLIIAICCVVLLCIGVSLYEIRKDTSITLVLGSLLIRVALACSLLSYTRLENREIYSVLCCFADPKFLISCVRDIIQAFTSQMKDNSAIGDNSQQGRTSVSSKVRERHDDG